MPSIDARALVQGLIIFVLSIAVHEFAHAFVADRLGDRLPRHQGRVTLNPLAHADPIGTLLFPALGILFHAGTFGWGRPVQVSPGSFTRKLRMRTAHMLVAAAGPAMNLVFGTFISLILFALYHTNVLPHTSGLYVALCQAIFINYVLCIFNLIPSPPLDGGTVLAGLLPDRLVPGYNRLAPYGVFVLIAFLLIPGLGQIIIGPARFLYQGWLGGVLGIPTPML